MNNIKQTNKQNKKKKKKKKKKKNKRKRKKTTRLCNKSPWASAETSADKASISDNHISRWARSLGRLLQGCCKVVVVGCIRSSAAGRCVLNAFCTSLLYHPRMSHRTLCRSQLFSYVRMWPGRRFQWIAIMFFRSTSSSFSLVSINVNSNVCLSTSFFSFPPFSPCVSDPTCTVALSL